MNDTGRTSVDLSSGLEVVPVAIQQGSDHRTLPKFQYSPDNIQGAGCSVDPSEVNLPGCPCQSHSCCSETCTCLKTHGPAYNGNGTLINISKTDAAYCDPVFECNALCACGDECSNRVVQRGVTLKLEVFNTGNRGWGVRALQPITRGMFVCEYAGEVVGFDEARRRQLAQTPEDNNYIIALREHSGTGSITETFVDPGIVGNVGRFLNHSCLPNLFMLPVRVHSVIPRLALFAGRDIDAKEELMFDYSGGYRNQPSSELQSTQSGKDIQASRTQAPQRKACHCGANNCAQFLPLDLSIIN